MDFSGFEDKFGENFGPDVTFLNSHRRDTLQTAYYESSRLYTFIVAEESKGEKFVPAYLPDEYKKNGLEVTFDGDIGKADKSGTALNIHKIWVAYELKEKYKLIHKSYDLN